MTELLPIDRTLRQVAGEDGISYDAARVRLARKGLRAVPERAEPRAIAATMPPEQAVAWLLDCLDVLRTAPAPLDLPPGLRGQTARAFLCLAAAPGRVVTHERMMAWLYFDRPHDHWPLRPGLSVLIARLRRHLAGTPWRVETVWGLGWRLVAANA